MRQIGFALVALGALGLLLAMNMDTSVSTGFGRVNNIGLMNDKQNYIIIASVLLVAGVLLAAIGTLGGSAEAANEMRPSLATSGPAETRACPFCAETIKAEAIKCRHCGSDVEALVSVCGFCDVRVVKPGLPCSKVESGELRVEGMSIKSARCRQELASRGFISPEVGAEA